MAIDGILYVRRTGCQWKTVPKEFSSGSTCHLRFSQWVKASAFAKLWAILLERYDELKGIDWQWQALDSATAKAPLGGDETGSNPTDRGKSGSKRHLITEGQGIPVGTTLSGANRHDIRIGSNYQLSLTKTFDARRREGSKNLIQLHRETLEEGGFE
ncbi:MAG: hypothetical protein DDT24_00638 [Chloroflexi bacterium]|nr:hypothetical protein [Chloroflexota bacterium]